MSEKMSQQLDEFQQKWNNGELQGTQRTEQVPVQSESIAEVPQKEKTVEEVNKEFWDKLHKEEEQREKIENIKKDIEKNIFVSIDGKATNDNMIVSQKTIVETPKKKKKWWQF